MSTCKCAPWLKNWCILMPTIDTPMQKLSVSVCPNSAADRRAVKSVAIVEEYLRSSTAPPLFHLQVVTSSVNRHAAAATILHHGHSNCMMRPSVTVMHNLRLLPCDKFVQWGLQGACVCVCGSCVCVWGGGRGGPHFFKIVSAYLKKNEERTP